LTAERWSPERPTTLAVEPEQHAFDLRYEDVCQDGRLTMMGIPPALGEVFWRKIFARSGLERVFRRARAVPILTRLCTEGGEGPLAIQRSVMGEGAYRLAHAKNTEGEVDRLFLEVWIDLLAPRATTGGSPPPGPPPGALLGSPDDPPIKVGRLYAEHILTRPFAPPAERRVTCLDSVSDATVPAVASPEIELAAAERNWLPPHRLLKLPDGAKPLDAALRLAPPAVTLGLDHTDSNQHVNSLVYPRVFQQAALDRLASLGGKGVLLARCQDTVFRKPLFAGQRVAIALQAFEMNGVVGAVGCFLDAAEGIAVAEESLSSKAARETAYAYARVSYEAPSSSAR